MSDVYLGGFNYGKLSQSFKDAGTQAADLKLQTGDTGTPQVGTGIKTPVPTDAVSDKGVDVGGGADVKVDPNTPPKDDDGSGIDDKTLIKIGTPLLILGAAAIYYFYFYKKKK